MKHRYKPYSIQLLCFLCIALVFCGCIGGKKLSEQNTKKSLSVYFDMQNNEEVWTSLVVNSFKKKFTDIDIVYYDPSRGEAALNNDDINFVFTADMLSGNGPDVIITNGWSLSVKTLLSGAFFDLDQFIDNDVSINIDDYNSTIMNSGVINNQRIFMPIQYYQCNLLTTDYKLNHTLISPASLQTADGLLNSFGKALDNGYVPAYESMFKVIASYSFLYDIFDYNNRSINIEENFLRTIIDTWKEIHIMAKDTPPAYNCEYAYENDILFFADINMSFQAGYYLLCDSDCVVIPPMNRENGSTALIYVYSLINANSRNPELSWEFIKCSLEYDFQKRVESHKRIPVMTNCVKKYFDYWCGFYGVPDAVIDFDNAADRISAALTVGQMDDIITYLDMFLPYINNEKSFEECYAFASNYFSIYLSE